MKKLKFYQDAGHGWLQVPTQELFDLGIYDVISHYSYVKDQYHYLEEDMDAGTYLDAAKKAGWEVISERVDQGNFSPIRRFKRHITR